MIIETLKGILCNTLAGHKGVQCWPIREVSRAIEVAHLFLPTSTEKMVENLSITTLALRCHVSDFWVSLSMWIVKIAFDTVHTCACALGIDQIEL